MSTYTDVAHLYDRLHGFKDYGREIDHVLALVQRESPAARTLLDVACGTGNHLAGLGQRFDVEGLDLSPQMLAQARRKFPETRFHEASMVDFDLNRSFDVVCCLFRSIALVQTREALRICVKTLARHTAPGGLVLVEPFFTPDSFWTGYVKLHELRESDLTVAWMYTAERDGDLGVFRNHYLVGEGGAVRHLTENHVFGLFRHTDFEQAFADAGLRLQYEQTGPSGLGFYIGRKPGPGSPD